MNSFASSRISSCSHDALDEKTLESETFCPWDGHVFLPAHSLQEKLNALSVHDRLYSLLAEYYCIATAESLKMDDIYIYTIYTVVAKMIRTVVSSAAKNGLKSVISIFCSTVSEGNISLHFQTFILPLIVIIQWDCCAPHRDLIWSSSVCLESHEETEQTETKSRRTVSQDASRNLLQSSWETLLKSTEDKSCFKHKDAHNKWWFHLVNRS